MLSRLLFQMSLLFYQSEFSRREDPKKEETEAIIKEVLGGRFSTRHITSFPSLTTCNIKIMRQIKYTFFGVCVCVFGWCIKRKALWLLCVSEKRGNRRSCGGSLLFVMFCTIAVSISNQYTTERSTEKTLKIQAHPRKRQHNFTQTITI